MCAPVYINQQLSPSFFIFRLSRFLWRTVLGEGQLSARKRLLTSGEFFTSTHVA